MKNITLLTIALTFFGLSTVFANHHPNHRHCKARYYYIPEIDSYYDMNADLFVWRDCNVWRRTYKLPRYLRGYNPNNIIVIHDYFGPQPYKFHKWKKFHHKKHKFNNHHDNYVRHHNRRDMDSHKRSGNRNNYHNKRSQPSHSVNPNTRIKHSGRR